MEEEEKERSCVVSSHPLAASDDQADPAQLPLVGWLVGWLGRYCPNTFHHLLGKGGGRRTKEDSVQMGANEGKRGGGGYNICLAMAAERNHGDGTTACKRNRGRNEDGRWEGRRRRRRRLTVGRSKLLPTTTAKDSYILCHSRIGKRE